MKETNNNRTGFSGIEPLEMKNEWQIKYEELLEECNVLKTSIEEKDMALNKLMRENNKRMSAMSAIANLLTAVM